VDLNGIKPDSLPKLRTVSGIQYVHNSFFDKYCSN
jgi:hypothetical protein